MECAIKLILETAQCMRNGRERRFLGIIPNASSESECWLINVFAIMFPHLKLDLISTEKGMEVYAGWPKSKNPLASIFPEVLLGTNIHFRTYDVGSRIDQRFPVTVVDGKFRCRLESGQECVIDNKLFESNPFLRQALCGTRINHEEWEDVWLKTLSDASAHAAGAVMHPDW